MFAGLSGVFGWFNDTSNDTGLSRGAAGIVDVGNGTLGDKSGFLKAAQSLMVTTADFSTAANTNLQTITGLSVTLPSLSANWGFTCDLVISQATATGGDKIGVQTATNAPTILTAGGFVGSIATGAIADVSTTTAQPVVTFGPTSGTKYSVHLSGGIEGASASGTMLNIMVATNNSSDPITVYRGSSCWVY